MKLELIDLFERIEVPAENQVGVVLAMKDLLGVGETNNETIGSDNGKI
jgi:hypothetical protein